MLRQGSASDQGTVKAFDIKTGKVKKPREFTRLPMPDKVVKIVNQWGRRSQRESQADKLEFLNRHKQRFDWDNDEIVDEGLVQDEIPLPEIPAEMPGIPLAGHSDDAVEVLRPSDAEQSHAAEVNGAIGNIAPPSSTGVPTAVDEVIIDDDDADDGAQEL